MYGHTRQLQGQDKSALPRSPLQLARLAHERRAFPGTQPGCHFNLSLMWYLFNVPVRSIGWFYCGLHRSCRFGYLAYSGPFYFDYYIRFGWVELGFSKLPY